MARLLRTQSDQRLVRLSRQGHERAFEAIVERYRKPLHRECRRVLSEARAEDAVQHTFMAAWAALLRGDDVRELRPWLHRIAHNEALNLARVSGYDYDELRESLRLVDAPDEELERRIVVRQTLAGIAALPERQREALLRTAVEGTSHDAVAREFGLSSGAVRQLVHRARAALRTAMTAVTPLPIAAWLAAAGTRSEPMAQRVAELATGGASAGAAATLAKIGTAAVVAGGVAAGPAILHDRDPRPARAAAPEQRAAKVAAPVIAAREVFDAGGGGETMPADDRTGSARPPGSDDPVPGDDDRGSDRGRDRVDELGPDDDDRRSDDDDRRSEDDERGSDDDEQGSDDDERGSDDDEQGSDDERGSDDDEQGSDDDDHPSGRDDRGRKDDDREPDREERGSGDDRGSGNQDGGTGDDPGSGPVDRGSGDDDERGSDDRAPKQAHERKPSREEPVMEEPAPVAGDVESDAPEPPEPEVEDEQGSDKSKIDA